MSRTRRLVRLFAVVAILAGVLVPAAAASAQINDYECEEENYNSTNPDHRLYGRSVAGQATAPGPNGTTKMVVDLRGMTPAGAGFLVFWDRYFVPGTDGVIVYGSSGNDLVCATDGDDWVWGFMGNDRIFLNGADTNYSSATYTPAGGTATTPWTDFGDHASGGKGHDFITTGDSESLSDAFSDGSARIGGGMGNDVIFLGGDDNNDNCLLVPGCADGTPTARGGEGDDSLYLGSSWDTDNWTMRGGAGNDYIAMCNGDGGFAYGNGGDDWIEGGGAANTGCSGAGDDNTAFGNNGDDSIFGNDEDDFRAFLGKGNDYGEAGWDNDQSFFGNDGDDTIANMGDDYNQTADGGPGNDTITGSTYDGYGYNGFGGAGDDVLVGSNGDDCLFGDYADDGQYLTSNGNDDADYYPFYQSGISCESYSIPFISEDPFFVNPATSGNDTIWGMEGDDLLRGGPGSDSIWGNYPKPVNPNIGLDVSDGDADWLGGGDGDDFLYGNECFLAGDDDWANGGGDSVSGDTTHGFTTAFFWPTTQNVENFFDQSVCLVVDP